MTAKVTHQKARRAEPPGTGNGSRGLAAWAVEWRSRNRLDGDQRHLQWNPEPGPGAFRLFRTRRECRAYIEERYGYIRTRPDLRAEPFGWFMPAAVMVVVGYAAADRR